MKTFMTMALLLALTLCRPDISKAEHWPAFEDFVTKCVLIVKAKAIVEKNDTISFEVIETWKGTYDPKVITRTNPEGRYYAYQDEHGVINVSTGQEVILFFSNHNQTTPGKFSPHSTAFPVRDNKVVYGSTSWTLAETFTLEDFKTKIQDLVNQEAMLMQMINALSIFQLGELDAKVKERLAELAELERKKRVVLPPRLRKEDVIKAERKRMGVTEPLPPKQPK